MMNSSLIQMIFGVAVTIITGYVVWVHRRQSGLEKRVGDLERQVAAFGDVCQAFLQQDAAAASSAAGRTVNATSSGDTLTIRAHQNSGSTVTVVR